MRTEAASKAPSRFDPVFRLERAERSIERPRGSFSKKEVKKAYIVKEQELPHPQLRKAWAHRPRLRASRLDPLSTAEFDVLALNVNVHSTKVH